ncbi:MAG: hypothetical protein HGB18_02280 [Candidatus Moranbacteria bacterium]|nr:hypothetical protein [Candidatus Moranbacteria bacterium]
MNQKKTVFASLAIVAVGVSGYFAVRAIRQAIDMAGEMIASIPFAYSYGRKEG